MRHLFEDFLPFLAILAHTLTATDPDGDTFVFAVDSTQPPPSGSVTIHPDGKLEYSPCMDCAGKDRVYYTVTETNMGDIPALTASASVEIRVVSVKDAPEIFLSSNATVIFSQDMEDNTKSVSLIHYLDLLLLKTFPENFNLQQHGGIQILIMHGVHFIIMWLHGPIR